LTPEAAERAEQKHRRTEEATRNYDERILTFPEWCTLNSLSPATGRRLLKSGDGPKVVQLSPRRIGVSLRANREWLATRAR
jgi:predicted DNA-binding transcriptional regulator AlpA